MRTQRNRFQWQEAGIRPRLAMLALLVSAAWSLQGENVFVTSYKGTAATEDVTPCPPSCTTGASISGASTASASTATPTPVIPASGRRVVFGNAAGATWSVTPTDTVLTPKDSATGYTFTSLQHIGVYKIYVTKGQSGNASPDILVSMAATGGDLADTNGQPAASITLDLFQESKPNHVWVHVGYITNSVPSPTLTFTHTSGTIASTGGRWYMDAVWFEFQDPCTGVATEVGIAGPLAQGQTVVNVTGVVEGATQVVVYADGSQIGQTTSAGFAAGTVPVSVTPLVKGASITAKQVKGACSGTPPGTGPVVGGGPNSKLSAFLSCWKNANLAGPIGAETTSGLTENYFINATALRSAFGTAPVGGRELNPDACWKLAIFDHASDPTMYAGTATVFTNPDRFCALEGLVFAIETNDSGPYDIYVDSIMNGDVVVEGFEGYEPDTIQTFTAPNQAASPSASSTYVSAPNSSLVSTNYAFDGTNSCRIQWQWVDGNNIRWAHVLANADSGKHYPQLDLSKQITVRYLVLPAGVAKDHKFSGTVGPITGHAPAYATGSNYLSVAVSGPGPYTFQWSWNGSVIADATSSGLGIGTYGLSAFDDGAYSVAVSDGVCTETRSATVTVVDPIPSITNQPAHAVVAEGSTVNAMTVGADGHVPYGYPLYYQWRFNGNDILGQFTETLQIANAQRSNVGIYDVVVFNAYGSVTSIVQTLAVVPAGITAGTGTGLRGDYWSTHDSTNAFAGSPALTRTDPIVDFDWSENAPGAGVSAEYFTARWTGEVQALGTDTYTFSTISDDGVRLWVNGQNLVDNWTLHGPTTNSATITLTGAEKYPIQMEFFEQTGGAVAKLYWSSQSGSIGFEPVPTSQLYPAAAPPVPVFRYALVSGTNLVFTWGPGSANVVWASDVAGPYTNVIYSGISPCTVPVGAEPARFFRLEVR
ncbi:MAG TPA: PA14 domain-containing protein [Candidatus Paceibacterota bacterium]|nr:PA14 domain-containing protein [Verrucomicrobiota bacterium]HRZ45718.1 PA14 domain-containing protein [Candidatus Paceibacterota bacterium]